MVRGRTLSSRRECLNSASPGRRGVGQRLNRRLGGKVRRGEFEKKDLKENPSSPIIQTKKKGKERAIQPYEEKGKETLPSRKKKKGCFAAARLRDYVHLSSTRCEFSPPFKKNQDYRKASLTLRPAA